MKYRKKPVVIDAYIADKEEIIHTLEGDMKAMIMTKSPFKEV